MKPFTRLKKSRFFQEASHSWGYVSCAGSEIGLKSAVYAGMAQAQAGYEIAKDPSVIKPWREDLDRQLKEDGCLKPIKPITMLPQPCTALIVWQRALKISQIQRQQRGHRKKPKLR